MYSAGGGRILVALEVIIKTKAVSQTVVQKNTVTAFIKS